MARGLTDAEERPRHGAASLKGRHDGAIPIVYFSDVLCVWAYFAELRLAAVQSAFGGQVQFDFRFCSVFGDAPRKMATAWDAKGGYEGFADHLQHVAQQFPELRLHPDLWRKVRAGFVPLPASLSEGRPD